MYYQPCPLSAEHFKQRPLTILGSSQASSTLLGALNDVLQSKSPIVKMGKDLKEGGRLCTLRLHPSEHQMTEIQNLLEKYIDALMSNSHDRSQYCLHFPFLTQPLCQCGKKKVLDVIEQRISKSLVFILNMRKMR